MTYVRVALVVQLEAGPTSPALSKGDGGTMKRTIMLVTANKPVGDGDFLADLWRKCQVVRSRTNVRTDVEGGS